ncbi:MAG TPA: nuclear transport factor 2 family protein [Gemmatimonadales bacterium]|nr:nuclear transport factor 2 family protein [Gemmatimonadales bacterium]
MHMSVNTSELLEVERQFWQAMQEKNGAAAAKLVDDGSIVVGAQGVSTVDATAMARLTTEGKWELKNFAIDDGSARVRFLDSDTALVAYRVHEEIQVDGSPLEFDACDASVWVRRDGRWVCAMHTESLVGDPFGRDKQAAKQ